MRIADRPAASLPTLEAKVAYLGNPVSYPEATCRVERVETHMSWVFLTDRHAWKLKKPVRQSYLDFTTEAARRFYCSEEVRLNRRLTHDVYLESVALTVGADGQLRFGGDGVVVDWLVKMRRLPADRMLDHLIRAGSVRAADVESVVAVLCRFYRDRETVAMAPREYRARFVAGIADNVRELSNPEFALPQAAIQQACAGQRALLERAPELFDERARSGRIVEAHGDLRPEHICVEPLPQIIDCLEFSRDFRILDPVDELAFLALECERLGAAWVPQVILDTYTRHGGGAVPVSLVHFYQSYRASMRAKIAIWHLKEPAIANPAKWRAQALDYLRLATQHVALCVARG